MLFWLVACDGDVMPLFIFPYGLPLNTAANIKYQEKVGMPCIEKVASMKPYVSQQDSEKKQFSLSENSCDHLTYNMERLKNITWRD